VRKLEPFRRFLYVAAQMSGKIINHSKIAREVGVSSPTVQSYFQILDDTLLGITLDSYHKSVRKSQKESPKFYFFDTGVVRSLRNTLTLGLQPQTYNYGELFEHFVINEIYRLQHYLKKDFRLFYLCTKSGLEIDLIIERPGLKTVLIEIKSTNNITEEKIKPLKKLSKDIPDSVSYCFSLDKIPKKFDNVSCLFWQNGLTEIGLKN
jgi:predicted AAA+ superfamily ATPase